MEMPIAQWPVIWPSSRLAIGAAIIGLAAAMGRPLRTTESIAVRAHDPNTNQLQLQAKDQVGRDSHHVCKMEILHQIHQQLLIPQSMGAAQKLHLLAPPFSMLFHETFGIPHC